MRLWESSIAGRVIQPAGLEERPRSLRPHHPPRAAASKWPHLQLAALLEVFPTITRRKTYVVLSGGGTLVTGGHIVNGRKSAPDGEVTKTLNGPSCGGIIAGDDVVKRVVGPGDIVIIPATVPHGWINITDHVDYLSVRPDPDRVLPAGYVNPAIKK